MFGIGLFCGFIAGAVAATAVIQQRLKYIEKNMYVRNLRRVK